MDHSFHTQDQVYEFWSLPLQEERNNVSNRRDPLSPLVGPITVLFQPQLVEADLPIGDTVQCRLRVSFL